MYNVLLSTFCLRTTSKTKYSLLQLLQNLQTLHLRVDAARVETVWHSLQSKHKKSGDSEEAEGEEKDAKKKNKGTAGGSRKPDEPSKDKEGDETKSREEEAGDKEEGQAGDSQGKKEQGVDEKSADKHQVYNYIADWLRCISQRRHHAPPC